MRKTLVVVVAFLVCCVFLAGAEPKKIEIFTHYQEATKQHGVDVLMAGAAKKYPGFTFTAEHLAYSQFLEVMKTRMASGDAPDVFQARTYEYPQFIDAGMILDLTGQPFVKRIDEKALKEGYVNGRLWSLPTDLECRGVFYNKNMFKSRGIKVPTTRSEWIAACTQFKAAGITPLALGLKQQNVCYDLLETCLFPRLAKDDPNLFPDVMAHNRKLGDSNDFHAALKDLNEMVLAFMDPGDVGVDQEQAYKNWAGEKRPMVLAGTWALADMRMNNPKGSLGVFPFPVYENPSSNGLAFGTDDNYMVYAKSKATDGALAFLEYVTSPEGINAWNRETKMITATKNAKYPNPDEMIADVLGCITKGQVYIRIDAKPPSGEYYTHMFESMQAFATQSAADRMNYDKFISQVDDELSAIE